MASVGLHSTAGVAMTGEVLNIGSWYLGTTACPCKSLNAANERIGRDAVLKPPAPKDMNSNIFCWVCCICTMPFIKPAAKVSKVEVPLEVGSKTTGVATTDGGAPPRQRYVASTAITSQLT